MNLDAKSFLLPTTTTTYIPKGAMLHTFTDIEKGIRYLLVVCICIVSYICNRKLFYGLDNKILFWRAPWWFDNYIVNDFKIKTTSNK